MDSLYEFLDSLNAFSDSLKSLEFDKQDVNAKIEDLPNGEMKEFFKQSLKEANEGTLNIKGFISNIEKFKNAN